MDHPSEDSNEESSQEKLMDEEISPVYFEHPKNGTGDGAVGEVNKDWSILGDCLEDNIHKDRMEFTRKFRRTGNDEIIEDRMVNEEIIPVYLPHTDKEVDDDDYSNELPCYEESAVEEQIVPVYMDHPSEDSNEGEITNETIHEEIVMAEESAPVSSEKRMENTAMEQGDESAASNVTTGYGKVEINLTPPSSPQGAERTPQKSAEDHTSGVPVPKKKINRKRYTGARREYLPMKDGLPIGLRPTSLEKEVQSATASENNKEPKEKSLPAQSKELGQDDKEEKKKPLKKNKDGSSRIPLPASIPITGATQSVTDEAGPEGASKSKSKRRRKKKGPGKSATNELSNRWPPT